MTRYNLLLLLTMLALPLYGQPIPGADGECTQAIWDHGKPLLVIHQDSQGNTLSLKAYAYEPENGLPTQVTHYRDNAHWERTSYTYSGNRVLTMAVYGPSGLIDTLSLQKADTSGRAGWASMPKTPDPVAEWQCAQEACNLCRLDSLLSADPLDGESFLFASDGRFLSRVQSAYPEGSLLLWQGEGRAPVTARFADPDYDPRHTGPSSRAYLVQDTDIDGAMQTCGARQATPKGIFPGCLFLLKNSAYGGSLDFAIRPEYGIHPDTFYITRTQKEGTLAHNHFNYGNFLWGTSARELGVPLWIACLGAHFNNFFLSPDSRFQLDSADDQRSIRAGHHWRPIH